MRTSPKQGEAWRLEERRKEARFTLILRGGLLEHSGRSSLCLVKNISTSGVQVKLYTGPGVGEEVTLRIADEPPVHGRLIWIQGDIGGISFHEDLDAPALLRVQQKLKSTRRRAMPRVQVEVTTTLRSGGRTCRATILDISSLGARVRSTSRLPNGNRVILEIPDLGPIKGYVRWSDGQESGVTFETPIPMHVIASWVHGRDPQHA